MTDTGKIIDMSKYKLENVRKKTPKQTSLGRLETPNESTSRRLALLMGKDCKRCGQGLLNCEGSVCQDCSAEIGKE